MMHVTLHGRDKPITTEVLHYTEDGGHEFWELRITTVEGSASIFTWSGEQMASLRDHVYTTPVRQA